MSHPHTVIIHVQVCGISMADSIQIKNYIKSLGLTGTDADAKRAELEKLSNAELVALISGSTKENSKGTSVEKDLHNEKNITLASGRRIQIKDGVTKYFAADGTELNQKYFQQKEGIINVKNSGRYSVTLGGETKYYAADGTELKESYFKQVESSDIHVKTDDGKTHNLNKELETRINTVTTNLEDAEKDNGFIGKAWSGFKNLTGIGDSSDKVREQQQQEIKLLAQFNSNEQTRAQTFKELTGVEYTEENLQKFVKGEIKLKSEMALQGYKEGQEMATDVAADIVSGIASVGIYAASVAAAPFTGGASIAVGLAAATAGGAAIKTGLKAADAASAGREYSLKDAGHDAATGAFSGVLAPVTGGMGGAVGKTVATKLGVQAIKQVGKEVAAEAAEAGVKQGVKSMLTNPTGYEYVGGTLLKRGVAQGAEMATDGAVGGAVDNAFRTAYDGGSLEDVANSAVEGFVGGAIMSPVIGGGMKAAGKGAQNIFGKDNVNIDANGNKISQHSSAGADDIRQLSREELKQKLKEGIKLERSDLKEIHIPKGEFTAPSAKFAATKEAYIDMLYDYAYDFAYLNANIKDKTILAKAINQIGNEGMDFTGIEHPFKINNSMSDRGLAAFDGSSEVEINTRRFGLSSEFNNDVAELSHRIFHEKRHVYQNIQRSLGFGENEFAPLELYSGDLADGTVNRTGTTQAQYYNYVKNNQYDYNAVQDGRFPANVDDADIKYGMQVSESQANYISNGPEYWTQFVEKDAEGIGMLCGEVVENIINTVPPDATKISPIAKAAKYAQDNRIDFEDAYKIITTRENKITLKKQITETRKLDPVEQFAINEIATRIKNKYPNISTEQIQFIIKDARNLLDEPKYSNMHYMDFVEEVVNMYTN